MSSTWSGPTSDAHPDRGADVVDGTETRATGPTCSSTAPASPPSATGRRRPPTAPSTPTGWCSPPASSTCTPTPTWPLLDPAHQAKVSQGVTTEVLGQDGLSYAPVDDAALAMLRRKIAGWNGDPARICSAGAAWRSTWTGWTRASPATPPTWSRTAPCGRWSSAGTTGRPPRPRWRPCGPSWRTAMAEGAVGMSAGLPTPRACTPTPGNWSRCCDGRRARRLFLPAPPLLRRGRAGGLRGDDRPGHPRRLPAAPRARHDELRPEQGPGRRAAGPAGRGDRRRPDITLDTYPYLPGATTLSALLPSWAPPAARTRRCAGCATRPRGSGSGRTWRSTAPTAATA